MPDLKRKFLVLAVIILPVIFSQCQNVDRASNPELDQIDFEIVILNDNGVDAETFEPGTDIKIALRVINKSDQQLEWHYDYTCQLFQTEGFLLVYRMNQGNETGANYLPVGTPYVSPVNCPTINYPPQSIPPGETFIINLPWSNNPENKSLSTGKYFTASNFELKIHGQTREWDLRTDFEIL